LVVKLLLTAVTVTSTPPQLTLTTLSEVPLQYIYDDFTIVSVNNSNSDDDDDDSNNNNNNTDNFVIVC